MRQLPVNRVVAIFLVTACVLLPFPAFAVDPEPEDYKVLKEIIVLEFSRETPHERGPLVPGVKTRLKTAEKVIAVTLEASGRGGVSAGGELLSVLEKENIPATVFVSGNWLDKNPALAKNLVANPNFEIANLGLEARSCSVDGKSPDGTPATQSTEEVFTEIEKNARKIESLTGVLPRFFRAGAAFYDDVAVRIARALGYEVVAASVTPKAAAEQAAARLPDALLKATAGSIAVIPLDGPGGGAANALRQAITKLRTKGFQFVKLGDYPLE